MPLLSPEQKDLLIQVQAANGLDQLDPASASNRMNAARTKVIQSPRPFTLAGVMGLLSPEHVNAVMDYHLSSRVIDAIEANDRQAVGMYATLFVGKGFISASERDAVLAVLAATDPREVPEKSLYDEHFGGFSYEIEEVEEEKLFNPDGTPQVDGSGAQLYGPAVHRTRYGRCHAALIVEARS